MDVCTLISNPNMYGGEELVILGLYRMVIHGSIMTGPGCKTTAVNMRRAPNWKGNKQAQTVLKTETKKNQFQPVGARSRSSALYRQSRPPLRGVEGLSVV